MFTPPHPLDSVRWRGLRIGILGGTFDPPHAGHIHISLMAMRHFRLDCVWWLVTPQNPLKGTAAAFSDRLDQCRVMTRKHPRILVTDMERELGTSRSVKTLDKIAKSFPGADFLFIGGTDNAARFHHWYRWRDLPDVMPVALIARPPAVEIVRSSPLKMLDSPHVKWVLHGPLNAQSSSNIRKHNNIR